MKLIATQRRLPFTFDRRISLLSSKRVRMSATPTVAEHLVVMVHGLNGHPDNWQALQVQLEQNLVEESDIRLHFFRSTANRKLKTFGGLQPCAERLSEEIVELVEAHPELKEISFLAHSMGGLISRFACGLHFNPATKTVFKLRPRHFLSIASPHLGCHHDGDSEVPILRWTKKIPLITPAVNTLTPALVPIIYRKTGRQLFLLDGKDRSNGLPLLCRLVQDFPEEGHYLSALKAFQTRTCYTNVSGDALVGWANASLRRKSELPKSIPEKLSNSIFLRADSLESSLWTDTSASEVVMEQIDKQPGPKESVEFMLKRLQSMPWCRIDVKIQGMLLPFLAHTHIQVTRSWLDFRGQPVIEHIAKTFVELEKLVKSRTEIN